MNHDDEYQAWLDSRRGAAPPARLAERIMSAVRESDPQSMTMPRTELARKTPLQGVIPYLVCSAAALVLAVRFYSMLSIFLVASPETDVAMIERMEGFFQEP